MRDIKFRAWKSDGIDSEMFRDIAFIDWNRNLIGLNYKLSKKATRLDKDCLDSFVLEQYTGLLDNNGKEIYEGDIVRYSEEDGRSFTSPVTYQEEWDYPAFDIDFPKEWLIEGNAISEGVSYNKIEVIGNIHENPELLEN